MDREIVYLKIDPDTYKLDASQFYYITRCQFCGHKEFNYRKLLSDSGLYRNLSWVQRCNSCHKTVASFRKNT